MTCPECAGRGAVEKAFLLIFTRTVECTRCNGIGTVAPPVRASLRRSVPVNPQAFIPRPVTPRTAAEPPETSSHAPSVYVPSRDDDPFFAAAVAGMSGGNPLTAGIATALTGNAALGVAAGHLFGDEAARAEACAPLAELPPHATEPEQSCAVPDVPSVYESPSESSGSFDSYDSGSSDSGGSDGGGDGGGGGD